MWKYLHNCLQKIVSVPIVIVRPVQRGRAIVTMKTLPILAYVLVFASIFIRVSAIGTIIAL